jgi:pyruvate-formate lyase-activating enzyme
MYLPGRKAFSKDASSPGLAVAAILPAGYTRTYLPAFERLPDAPRLPLYGYAAVALINDEVYVAAVKTDEGDKWNPLQFNTRHLKKLVAQKQKQHPTNRILQQLAHCSLKYHCCTAQNIFYRRWEGGIPVSPACNARCFGCISLQPSECCPSPQQRIQFTPTVEEIAEVMIDHLQDGEDPIISFGQGCEGEPSLQAERIAEAIRKVRSNTDRGVININTNAGYTDGIRLICQAGLESIRVSLISARADLYNAYYQPINYRLEDVITSIQIAKQHNVYVSLNLLVFPGVTDREEEVAQLEKLIENTGLDMIQMRNLNADPDELLKIVPPAQSQAIGVKVMIDRLIKKFPQLRIGSYSRYIKK